MSDEVEVFDGLLDDLIGAANKLGRYEELGAWGLPDLEESVKTTRVKVYKLYSEAFTRIAELSQAVGLITTLKPTMVMDANHPLDMVREVAEHVTARIAELEAAHRWIPVSERMPDDWESVLTIDISKSTQDVVSAFYNPETSLWETHFSCGLWVTHWMPLQTPPEAK